MTKLFALLPGLIFFFNAPLKAQIGMGAITIVFKNKVGNDAVEAGKTYHNAFNEPFTVARLKYYLSGITFHDTQARPKANNEYFLINQEDSSSHNVEIAVPHGSYTAISFTVGVDSIKNVSGTQADALDPMNGMFWTWNSGYIMAKLEGTSPLSKAPGQLIEYHIGGFRSSQNTVRNISLPFPTATTISTGNSRTKIVIEADINKWFKGRHDLKIADQQACTTPGEVAVRYADNYAGMFRLVSSIE